MVSLLFIWLHKVQKPLQRRKFKSVEAQDGCHTQTLFATYFVIYLLDKLRNLLAVCCSRWLTLCLLDHMYLMIPYTNLTILHMWLMIDTSIIASLLSRKFRQKERIQLNLLPALANSVRQPSFLTATRLQTWIKLN